MATFGFDERRVLPALRLLPYDRLVLLGGRTSFRAPGFRRLKSLEPSLQALTVDPFDFGSCLAAACRAFHDARPGDVRASVSGGTKILADATLLAAFQEGVEAWYFDPEPVRLPVLRGVRIHDVLGPADRTVAAILTGPMTAEAVLAAADRRGVSRAQGRRALRLLRTEGFLEARLEDGRPILRPSPLLEAYRVHLREPPKG